MLDSGTERSRRCSRFRAHSDSISSVRHSRLLVLGLASNIPTLNFAKNAKFRMGHPGMLFTT